MVRDYSEENRLALIKAVDRVVEIRDYNKILINIPSVLGDRSLEARLGFKDIQYSRQRYENLLYNQTAQFRRSIDDMFNRARFSDMVFRMKFSGYENRSRSALLMVKRLRMVMNPHAFMRPLGYHSALGPLIASLTIYPRVPSWFIKSLSNKDIYAKILIKSLKKTPGVLRDILKLPKFVIKGGYVRVLNTDYFKNASNFARRYTLKNILSGKYPRVSKAFNMYGALKVLGTAASVAGTVIKGHKEFFKDEALSMSRRISNTAVEVGTAIGFKKISAVVGTVAAKAIAGAKVGAVAGPKGIIVGAVAGVVCYVALDWLAEIPISDGKNIKQIVKDGVAPITDGVKKVVDASIKGATKFVGDCVQGAGSFFKRTIAPQVITGGFKLSMVA